MVEWYCWPNPHVEARVCTRTAQSQKKAQPGMICVLLSLSTSYSQGCQSQQRIRRCAFILSSQNIAVGEHCGAAAPMLFSLRRHQSILTRSSQKIKPLCDQRRRYAGRRGLLAYCQALVPFSLGPLHTRESNTRANSEGRACTCENVLQMVCVASVHMIHRAQR